MAGYDVQLKTLQTLPSLLHNYADETHGELLSGILELCCSLQTAKLPAVSNTATATLQQLVVVIFDHVVTEDGELPALDCNHSSD